MRHEPTCVEVFLTGLAFRFFGKAVYKSFADRLPLRGGERVLDFGCGMGTVAYYTAKKLPHGHLTALDISPRWLSVCRKTLCKYGNVSFLKSHPKSPVLEGESFDLVYCHFVLHNIVSSALEELIPVLTKSLKTGGSFVFREPLKEVKKLGVIRWLTEESGLILKDSRVTDIPLIGNTLESIYIKQ